ncbi:MAG TPA: serine protease [Planctomycetaceae bacterium]|nr:serine protease [Planctomycetaceae bacterium]
MIATRFQLAVFTMVTVISSGQLAQAQSVCLPAPRLLTTMPMGGKSGTLVEITIAGEHLEEAKELVFSDARLSATPKLNAAGQPEANKYLVTLAADCPPGVYEARLMTRLGLSSSRVFSVGTLTEVTRTQPNTKLDSALVLPLNSVCNAVITNRSVDHYSFEAKKDQRIIVDCATRGIDSKLDAVVIIADAMGRDLLVERRGGVLDYTIPADGKYVIKVHELTFKGGHDYFYRLGLWEQPAGTPIVRQPGTRTVNSFSWPPVGLPEQSMLAEAEPNNDGKKAMKITLPADLNGTFFPAADVDVFEFEAKKGEEWWVEVASERFGLPTDPAVIVQQVTKTADGEKTTDLAELADVPSPVKVSSNGYAYDGPPYDAGTADVLGKFVVKEDGLHRLQLTDLFGGTRNDVRNRYRLLIRKAAPDFALVAWAQHMELRNGDRAALSKPMSLRGGATMALEVIAFRRDGFAGDIDLTMSGLPEGVTAKGLKIPAGQSRGMIVITAHQDAPRGFANASFQGVAEINGAAVTRPVRLASMSWPIPDSWGEVPSPRLITDVPVSVGGSDLSPLTIKPQSTDVFEVKAGEKLTVPLVLQRRSEFSGATMQLKPIGAGFDRAPAFDINLTGDTAQATFDLAALKVNPGDYLVAFHGGAVAKYRHRVDQIAVAEAAQKQATEAAAAIDAEVKKLMDAVAAAPDDKKPEAMKAAEEAAARQKAAAAALNAANEQLKNANNVAQPRDIVDIVVSEPITIRVLPAETK